MDDNKLTLTFGNKTTNIILPLKPIRKWDKDIKVKFYQRGNRSWPTITKNGGFKPPRQETILYINGSYMLQFPTRLGQKGKETILETIIILYCYGCDFEEIKRLLRSCCLKRTWCGTRTQQVFLNNYSSTTSNIMWCITFCCTWSCYYFYSLHLKPTSNTLWCVCIT